MNSTTSSHHRAATVPAFAEHNVPPAGFTTLFNGKDLSGWYGLVTKDRADFLKMSPEEQAAYKKKSVEGGLPEGKQGPDHINAHWKVENGEIVNDGKGLYLTTDKDYGDFEFWVESKPFPRAIAASICAAIPQVQIWDTTNGDPRGSAKTRLGGLGTTARRAAGKTRRRKWISRSASGTASRFA